MPSREVVELVPPPPDRPADAHKGTFGTVIVVGGSATMMGAPALCAGSAFRSGAGLVKIAAHQDVLNVAIAIESGATGICLTDDATANVAQINQASAADRTVLAVGPGLGQSADRGKLVELLMNGNRPIVLDADGLNLLAATGLPRPDAPCDVVLTPHPGEFQRLAKPLGIDAVPTDPASRPTAAAALANAHRAVVVLKGQHTIVSDGQRIHTNTTGNPALATAGSGDVLTGCIAALIAQGMAPFDASILGVYLHGLGADIWAAEYGPVGMTASELIGLLPEAFALHRRACADG